MKTPRSALKPLLMIALCLMLGGCTRAARHNRHVAKAEKYLQQKKYREAELESLVALRLDSKSLRALSVLQNVYYDQGSVLKIIPVLRATEALDTNNIPARLMLARIYAVLNDVEQSRQRARAILEKDKHHLEATLILEEFAQTAEEVQEVDTLLAQWPKSDSPNYHLVKAAGHMHHLDWASAESELQQVLKADSRSLVARHYLASIAWRRGDLKRADAIFKDAAPLAAGQPFEEIRWAVFKMQTGELEEARKLLESIVERHPAFLPARTHLASIAFEQRRLEDCEKLVNSIMAEDRSLYKPLELLGRLKLARGATDEGIKILERAANVYGGVAQIHYHLAVAYLQKRDVPAGRKSLEKALSLDPNLADATVLLAELDARSGATKKAAAALENVLQRWPYFMRAHLLLAEVSRAQGDLPKAAREYQYLVQLNPKYPPFKLFLGMTYLQQKNTNAARAMLEKALEEAPDYVDAARQLVELDIASQNLQAASNRVSQLIARRPEAPEPQFLMARVHMASKQIGAAEACLNKSVELQPDFTAAYDALANLYAATGRESQALEKLEALLKKKPGDVRTLMQEGALLERMQQPSKAIAAYQKILEQNPNFVPALNNAAYLAAESGGNLEKALEMATKSTQLVKDSPELQDTLGWVLFKRGELATAASVLGEAAHRKPDEPSIQYHCALACLSVGERVAAKAALERALNSGKDFAGSRDARLRMDILALEGKADAQSIAKLDQARNNLPNDVGVLLLLGDTYERAGETNKAKQIYRETLKINSNSVPAMLKLAELCLASPTELDASLKLVTAAYPLTRDEPKLAYAIGKTAFRAGGYALALRSLQEAAAAGNQSDIDYDLALCSFWMGDVVAAETNTRRALGRGAGFGRQTEAQKFLQLLRLYQTQPLSAGDLSTIDSMAKQTPDWPPALLLNARAKEQTSATNEARKIFEDITARTPFFVPAANAYARFLTRTDNEPQRAQLLLEKSRQIAPLDPATSQVYGRALFLNGNYTNAIKVLQAAGVNDPELYYYIGLAYGRIGDKVRSRRMLNDALSSLPNHKLAADARELLERFAAEEKLPVVKSL